MEKQGKFILLKTDEFDEWLEETLPLISRQIKLIQLHHTYLPDYSNFTGSNHFKLCRGMEASHIERGFSEIAQNFTTFPDGTIMICRGLNTIPAGIKGANKNGICIENLGNFDSGKDAMTDAQKNCILTVTKNLLAAFELSAGDDTVVYHHWYDLNLGTRITEEGAGATKSCPGTNFFGGNTVADFTANFLPLLEVKVLA